MSKVNLDTVSAKNPYELAQGAKQAILKKVEEIFKIDSEKKAADLTVKDLANNKFLKPSKMIDSVKIDVLGKDPKHDSDLGFKTIPLCLNFATLEDKSKFKDEAKSLGINCKDSFPKMYIRQKEKALEIFKKSNNSQGQWVKADVRLGRPEAPVCITIQAKRGNTADKWTTKARVKVLPTSTWGRLSDVEKETHISAFLT